MLAYAGPGDAIVVHPGPDRRNLREVLNLVHDLAGRGNGPGLRPSPPVTAPGSPPAPIGGYLLRIRCCSPELAVQVLTWLYLLLVTDETGRVIIVGGGILGTMHAIMARRRGYAVTHLEREPDGRGASVRNFGLVWVSGRRAGPEVELALRARALWAEIGELAPGTGFRPAGSLTIATSDAELAVMREAAALPDAKQREFEVLSPDEVRSVNPALRGEFLGGLYCRADAIVEPRVTLPALRAALSGPAYEWLPGHEAIEVTAGGVRDQHGSWHRGDLVVLCTGAHYTGVAGPHLLTTTSAARAGGKDGATTPPTTGRPGERCRRRPRSRRPTGPSSCWCSASTDR